MHVLAATLHGKGKKSGGSPAAPSDLTAHLPLRQQCEEQRSWLTRFQRGKGLRWISGCFQQRNGSGKQQGSLVLFMCYTEAFHEL